MYKLSVPKTSAAWNKTFKGVLLKSVDMFGDIEKYFSKTGLKEKELLELLDADNEIVLEVIRDVTPEPVKRTRKPNKNKDTNEFGKPLITKDGLTESELEVSKQNGRIKD